MGVLLTVLGKKLAEQWLTLLALPGALYVAAVVGARTLGRDHTWDLDHLLDQITVWAEDPRIDTVAGQVVVFVAVVAASALVGLAAQGVSVALERVWFAADWASWPRFLPRLVDPLVGWRQQRWVRRHRAVEQARSPDHQFRSAEGHTFEVAYDRMARTGVEYPQRPTWCGDRLNALAQRLERDHDLDVAVVWPHLWLVLPDQVRLEITEARQGLGRATTLVAWGVLYLGLVVWWFPAVLVFAVLNVVGWWRTRAATEVYATLVEAAVRLHVGDLAERVGVDYSGLLTKQVGQDLSNRLRASFPSAPGL
ncbi:hypothetical protein A6A08_21440 [Nocardiopsis sp. TSRI0078]|uniref:hypothetical protein n=1 Tax=unclassified Nocardiopsis TaxID=2649073 RepID=UPI00093A10DA|nr:hypothetical protein [Nocardiopsis sp. TSRI0078]OKI21348.1 hypothetical protein A6A08_21440 [Nocardiopsis sp. TSRI0078]